MQRGPADHPRPADFPVLDLGGDIGALVLVTTAADEGREIELIPIDAPDRRVHVAVHPRPRGSRTVYAGVFPELPAGRYRIAADRPGLLDEVEIVGGRVTEVDWTTGSDASAEGVGSRDD